MDSRTQPFWKQRRNLLVFSFCAFPFLSFFLLTRPIFLALIVEAALFSAIGAKTTVSGAKWDWSGAISVDKITIKSDAVQGLASEVVTFEASTIRFDSIFPIFNRNIKAVDIQLIRLRLAESTENSGTFNFSNLLQTDFSSEMKNSNDTKNTQALAPQLNLHAFIIETGLMDGNDWIEDSKKKFDVAGTTQLDSQFGLELIDESHSVDINLNINTDFSAIDATIAKVKLDHDVFDLLPRTARIWCEETKLKGGFNELQVSWEILNGIKISAIIDSLSFLLPQQHGIPWATYVEGKIEDISGDALLDVEQGTIIYDGQELILKGIGGTIQPPNANADEKLQFSGEMKIHDFESAGEKEANQWMASMLSEAPFSATFTLDNFSSTEFQNGVNITVPEPAAQILKLFQLEAWEMNSKVNVNRKEHASKVEIQGQILLNAGSGMYEGFPYPLHDISSRIEFQQSDIKIVYLNAKGSQEAPIHINGSVIAGKEELRVDLSLHADGAPLDGTLRGALSEPIARIMDKLIDHEAYDRIADDLTSKRASEFRLGGKLDLDLKIFHDSLIDKGVDLTGEVRFENIGIMHNKFPFPVMVREGGVRLETDGLYIPEDKLVRFNGLEHGMGEMTGSIHFLEDGSAIPDLSLVLLNENVSSDLVAAVSDSAGESHELAAGILGGLGLHSKLNVYGTIIGESSGLIGTHFRVDILDGVAKPNARLADVIGANGQFWPDGFEFSEIEAEIYIDNGVVSMSGLTSRCGAGSVQASMNIDGGEFNLDINGANLPISSRFIDVLPASATTKLSAPWNIMNPSGSMNAKIRMSHAMDQFALHMEIEPTYFSVTDGNSETLMRLSSGSIVVENTSVFFNDLEFVLTGQNSSQGDLKIGGSVHAEEDAFGYDLEAIWSDALIESSLCKAITTIVGDESGSQYYDLIQPAGLVNASLLAQGDENSNTYSIDIFPKNIEATFHKRRAMAQFDSFDEKLNAIRFNNDGITFNNLYGQLGEGAFALNGSINSGDTIHGLFDFTWDGPTGDTSMFALLPKAVGDTLTAVNLSEGTSLLPDGILTFSGESWSDLVVAFAGNIKFDGVSMDVGVPLEKIIGTTRVSGRYSDENLSALEMSIAFSELTTLGRVITNIGGALEFEPDNERFQFKDMRGISSSGGVTVGGWIALDETKKYEIEILLAGVELDSASSENVVASLKGDLRGSISISGIRGDVQSKRGVGMIRVDDGYLAIDPLSLTTMRALQLALPTASSISGARIDSYIQGDKIYLENISLFSNDSDITDFVLEGDGTIDINTFQIKARLHPRAGLPLIRDLFGLFNDQLYSIDVTGELLNPEVSVVPLPFLSPQ